MTKLEGYRQAALRDGCSPEEWKHRLHKAMLIAGPPPGANEEIPAGEEEAFIAHQLNLKRQAKVIRDTTKPAAILRELRPWIRSIQKSN